jgi:hypothetical protein
VSSETSWIQWEEETQVQYDERGALESASDVGQVETLPSYHHGAREEIGRTGGRQVGNSDCILFSVHL